MLLQSRTLPWSNSGNEVRELLPSELHRCIPSDTRIMQGTHFMASLSRSLAKKAFAPCVKKFSPDMCSTAAPIRESPSFRIAIQIYERSYCLPRSDLAPCQIRGMSSRPGFAPFIESMWTHPETLRAMSEAAGVELVPIMPYEVFCSKSDRFRPGAYVTFLAWSCQCPTHLWSRHTLQAGA